MDSIAQIVLRKRKLARRLFARVRELERPDYLPFLTPERRRVRVMALRRRAEWEREEAKNLQARHRQEATGGDAQRTRYRKETESPRHGAGGSA